MVECLVKLNHMLIWVEWYGNQGYYCYLDALKAMTHFLYGCGMMTNHYYLTMSESFIKDIFYKPLNNHASPSLPLSLNHYS